jgi:hypothetical protein
MPVSNWLRLPQRYACLNVIDWYDLQPVLDLLNYDQWADPPGSLPDPES